VTKGRKVEGLRRKQPKCKHLRRKHLKIEVPKRKVARRGVLKTGDSMERNLEDEIFIDKGMLEMTLRRRCLVIRVKEINGSSRSI
jgi:hypothetical protein